MLDVALQLLVANYWHLLFDLGSSLASELNILLFGEQIPTRLDFLRTLRATPSDTRARTRNDFIVLTTFASPL